MNVQINRLNRRDEPGRIAAFFTSVNATVDGIVYEALIDGRDARPSQLFRFGREGDDCTTTHAVTNPAVLAAITAAAQ